MVAGPQAQAPSLTDIRSAALRRVLLPAAVLWAAVIGAGFVLVDVIQIDERPLSEAFVEARVPALDAVTSVVSGAANTTAIMATALLVAGLVWWRSGRWWFAAVPLIALATEAAVFLTSSAIVARSRPDVDQLDDAPPTSSFPSGHTGASSAVYFSFALMATRIQHRGLRAVVVVVCALFPVAVALSRVYRGMHHPTDVLGGLVVGATCAWIGWTWLREETD